MIEGEIFDVAFSVTDAIAQFFGDAHVHTFSTDLCESITAHKAVTPVEIEVNTVAQVLASAVSNQSRSADRYTFPTYLLSAFSTLDTVSSIEAEQLLIALSLANAVIDHRIQAQRNTVAVFIHFPARSTAVSSVIGVGRGIAGKVASAIAGQCWCADMHTFSALVDLAGWTHDAVSGIGTVVALRLASTATNVYWQTELLAVGPDFLKSFWAYQAVTIIKSKLGCVALRVAGLISYVTRETHCYAHTSLLFSPIRTY